MRIVGPMPSVDAGEITRIASDGNAYEILGLQQNVSFDNLKKRYWKLALLVHPDKCTHPEAQEAFRAINKAFKDLQDPLKRSEIDRKADEKLAKEEYKADIRARRGAAQWRKLRGEEALPGDAQLLQGDVKDQARDEWMTVLPPVRQAGGPPTQRNTFFSRAEKSGRGAGTDTPLEKEKAKKEAALVDQYNRKRRPLSLLEEHQQKSVKVKKANKGRSQPQEETWHCKKNSADVLRSRFGRRSFL